MMLATTKAVAQDNYGAIAYSQTADSHGYSYDYYSQSAAEGIQCIGRGCSVTRWVCANR